MDSSVGQGQGFAEIKFREEVTIQAGSPLWASRYPSPPAPGKSPNSCFLEQLEAEVSGRPAWRARMGVRMGGSACRRPHPP